MLPEIININGIGDEKIGFISVVENLKKIPFEIKRVYWTYLTPQHIVRGNHAHKELEQLIVAVSGSIQFILEDREGNTFNFNLDSPEKGLYIPKGYWRTIKFSENAVLLCLASEFYDEEDYIRDYKLFRK